MSKLSRRQSRAMRPGRIEQETIPRWLWLINEHRQKIDREYPGWFAVLDKVRASRNEINNNFGGWPDWCLVPLVASSYFCSRAYETDNDSTTIKNFMLMNALYAWEHTKTVWHFDKELARALEETTSLESVPSEILYKLPGWAVVIPIGAVVTITWLDYDRYYRGSSLRISLLSRNENGLVHDSIVIPLHYRTLGEGLSSFFAEVEHSALLHTTDVTQQDVETEAIRETYSIVQEIATWIVARLCYLLAEEPDVSERVPPEPHRGRVRRQARLGVQPAQPVRELDVGFRVGAALRAAREAGAQTFATDDEPAGQAGHRRSPVPHVRRAHWHLYWTGPRQGPRIPVLRWIPPVVVAASNAEDVVVPTVRPVRGTHPKV